MNRDPETTASELRSATARVAPADAWYLYSTSLHTDQLLVYGFAGSPLSVEQAVEEVIERAPNCERGSVAAVSTWACLRGYPVMSRLTRSSSTPPASSTGQNA